jgi:uncharacterized protein with PIN domain
VIVLDSSVLVGIIKGEADGEQLLNVLANEECAIGAPTLVETRVWYLNQSGGALIKLAGRVRRLWAQCDHSVQPRDGG